MEYARANWVFLRLLGFVYLFAFWSLAQQVTGLIGPDGILPAADYIAAVRTWADESGIGLDRYRLLPTLGWLSTSDRFLQGLTSAGAALALLQVAGFASVVVLPLLWILYLSIAVVGGDFLSYQWDALLLETGFLAIFLAPARWLDRLRDAADPPRLARWLIWWLLFRLTFGSGVVKLASGDPTWRGLTALAAHFETQPLPTPVAWYAAQLPLELDRVSTALVLGIELVLPWLILVPRTRKVAAFVLIALQASIALTGNYGFFNLLSAALCVMLFDDRVMRATMRGPTEAPPRHWLRKTAPIVAAIVTIPVSAAMLLGQLGLAIPSVADPALDVVTPFRSVNPYGLFAVMTTTRPEIVVEGSSDGSTWQAYEFRHKPGAPEKRPTWVAPFHPRLDWQMWFAALGQYESERWFQQFCRRLLEGSSSVNALLAENPFEAAPPRFVRARLYRYRFAESDDPAGSWWRRESLGEYSPVLPLDARR